MTTSKAWKILTSIKQRVKWVNNLHVGVDDPSDVLTVGDLSWITRKKYLEGSSKNGSEARKIWLLKYWSEGYIKKNYIKMIVIRTKAFYANNWLNMKMEKSVPKLCNFLTLEKHNRDPV